MYFGTRTLYERAGFREVVRRSSTRLVMRRRLRPRAVVRRTAFAGGSRRGARTTTSRPRGRRGTRARPSRAPARRRSASRGAPEGRRAPRREPDPAVVACRAHRTSRRRREGDDPLLRTAFDAALEMRQEALEPEQLQLEREDERIESGPPARLRRRRPAHRETASGRGTRDRSAPPRCRGGASPRGRRARPEAVRVDADRVVRADE